MVRGNSPGSHDVAVRTIVRGGRSCAPSCSPAAHAIRSHRREWPPLWISQSELPPGTSTSCGGESPAAVLAPMLITRTCAPTPIARRGCRGVPRGRERRGGGSSVSSRSLGCRDLRAPPSGRSGFCRGQSGPTIRTQDVGFAFAADCRSSAIRIFASSAWVTRIYDGASTSRSTCGVPFAFSLSTSRVDATSTAI